MHPVGAEEREKEGHEVHRESGKTLGAFIILQRNLIQVCVTGMGIRPHC